MENTYDGNNMYAENPEADEHEEAPVAAQPQQPQDPSSEYSLISKGTQITGNIKTIGNIDVLGEIVGDIEARGNVALHGVAIGDVSCEKLGLENCKVKGNLQANLGVIASEDAVIVGNVKTQNMLLDGKMKGNIEVDKVALIKENAYLVGDIVTEQVSIEMGAVFNGTLRMTKNDEDESSFFE